MPDNATARGRWTIAIDDHRLTGGTWFAEHDDDGATAGLDVSERWKPPRKVPLLIDGRRAVGWTRTGTAGSDDYRRATGTR